MNFKKLLLFVAAPLAMLMASCVTTEPEYTLPSIKVLNAEGQEITSVNFAAEGGEQTISIIATRNWNITYSAEWLGITPTSDTNALMKEETVAVTLTAGENDKEARNETIKITMDKTEVSIVVSQAGAGQVALGDVLYYDNFDKDGKQAQKGSSGWDTYMDSDAGRAFCNPTPENQAGVSYTGTKLTVRSNSANGSAGQHSNYEGSGLNYLWFGTAPTNFTISGISLAELEGNALTLSFGTERYQYEAPDNTFNPEEFKVYISGDGEKWSEVSYTFLEGVNLNGKWNIATAQFNLKEVPETLSIHFAASVGAAYAIDDVKLTAGGGGTEIDLAAGTDLGVETPGGDQPSGDAPTNLIEATIQEFLDAAVSSDTWYKLTGEIISIAKADYGNFTIKDATNEVYIYGMTNGWVGSNDKSFSQIGLKVGDTVTLGTLRGEYNGTPQGGGNPIPAYYISHVAGEGGEEPEPPVVAEGDYASDSIFVQTTDDSANAAYGLGETVINGNAVTGFKLGKSKQEGKFTSKAIGVEGDKYLNFYAVSWGAGGDKTIYFRVNGGEAIAQPIKANDGAAQNPPYNNLTPTENDHYSVQLTGLAATDVIEFSTNAAFDCAATTDYATRAIFFGVKLTDEALGGGTTTEPEPEPSVVKATVEEFLNAAEDATIYELTGTIKGTYNTEYGNFYLEDATGEVLIYGIVDGGEKCYTSLGLKDGDTVTIQGARTSYNGTPQMKNAEYISHTAGTTTEPEEPEEPEVPEGDYASDASFVCSTDDSANAVYGLGETVINGNAVTGFKLGTGKLAGVFTSDAVGVSGDKYLNFYAVAWKGKTATLYWRVDGGETQSQTLAAHDGATGNPPFIALTARDTDHYSVQLTGLTANSVIEFSTDASFSATSNSSSGRAIVFGIKLTDEALGSGTTTPEPEEPENPEPTEIIEASILEFLNAAESTSQWYKLTGKITNIANTTYGNFDLMDESGSVYVYGLTATQVSSNDKSFSTLGLEVGDTVTLIGTRSSYNGSAQVGGPAYYVSHEKGETEEPEVPEGATVAAVTFSTLGYANAQSVDGESIAIDENVSVVFKQGGASTAPAYYNSDAAIRMYQNGATLDVTANGKTITSIELTFANNHYYVAADSGELSAEAAVRTWTGSASAVKFTSTGTDKDHRAYVAAIKVTYTE